MTSTQLDPRTESSPHMAPSHMMTITSFVYSAPTEPSLPPARLALSHRTFRQHNPCLLASIGFHGLCPLFTYVFPVVEWAVDLYASRNLFKVSEHSFGSL